MLKSKTSKELKDIIQELERKIKVYEEQDTSLNVKDHKFKSFFENSPLGYQSLDENGNFIEINPTWLNILGYSRDEVIGKNFSEFLTHDWKNHFRENFPRFKAIGEIIGVEFEMLKKNGSTILVSFNGKIEKDPNGGFVRTHCVFQDITSRRNAELAEKRNERKSLLIKKNKSITQMAGAISHNFNNLLYVVMGNLEMVLEDLPSNSPFIEKITEAQNATRRAAKITNFLLTFLGQSSITKKPVELSALCVAQISTIKQNVKQGITIETEFPKTETVINADATAICQVLETIIENACESTVNSTNTIKITYDTAKVDALSKGRFFPIDFIPAAESYVRVSISDTGCGMDENTIDQIFDPFFTDKFTGRGLGLPAALGIIKAHSGCISVRSAPNNGSTFEFFLPITDKHVPIVIPSNTDDNKNFSSLSALVVDDNDSIRIVARKMLLRLGVTVIEASNGNEAVNTFRKNEKMINLVLCDLSMPGMDGWQTLKALKDIQPNIPVILFSGYSEKQIFHENHSEKPEVFLRKPFNLEELKNALSKALSKMSK